MWLGVLKRSDMAQSTEEIIDRKIRFGFSFDQISTYINDTWANESTKQAAISYLYECKCLRIVE